MIIDDQPPDNRELEKVCKDCKEFKVIDQFYRDKYMKDGRQSFCKDCGLARRKRARQEHPEVYAAIKRRYRQNNPEKVAAEEQRRRDSGRQAEAAQRLREKDPERARQYSRRYRLANPEKWAAILRDSRVRTQYGLAGGQGDYEAILASQGGVCAACGRDTPFKKPSSRANESFPVDHDHSCCPGEKSCGKCIRGLLCHRCNSVLAYVDDDPGLLRALADYLEKARAYLEIS